MDSWLELFDNELVAIEAEDGEAARAAMDLHVAHSADSVLALLGALGPG